MATKTKPAKPRPARSAPAKPKPAQPKPAKSVPFSIRLSPEIDEFVRGEAKLTKRSRGSILNELTEEAVRCRLFPGIAYRMGGNGTRRPWIVGTGFDIWMLIWFYQGYDGAGDRLVEDHDRLSEADIRLALAYYERFPEEIDEALARQNRPLEELRKEYPFIEVVELPAE